MNTIKKITGKKKNIHINIVQRPDGNYMLEHFERKFDPEEGGHYTTQVMHPSGIYADLSTAVEEAKRLLSV